RAVFSASSAGGFRFRMAPVFTTAPHRQGATRNPENCAAPGAMVPAPFSRLAPGGGCLRPVVAEQGKACWLTCGHGGAYVRVIVLDTSARLGYGSGCHGPDGPSGGRGMLAPRALAVALGHRARRRTSPCAALPPGRGLGSSGRARSRPTRRGAEVEGCRKEARVQPGPRRAYANGVGISTWTVPSASVVMPRASVSWRSPEPSGRIAKIWSPNGFAPTGSQFAEKRTVPVT